MLLFSFEQAGLVQRGPDCTLEATLLLNRPVGEVLDALSGAERTLAAQLFEALGAAQDRQASYSAARLYEQTGIDPRAVDPLLVQYANTLLKNKVLFGTDFPMLTPERWLADLQKTQIRDEERP